MKNIKKLKRIIFALVSAILCFSAMLSSVGCTGVYDKFGESDSDMSGAFIESGTLGLGETEKQTEKKTQKKTEKRTEKQTEAPLTFNVRFASYNIMHAGNNTDLKKIAANIKNNGIEIVGLQEVDNNTKRSGKVNQVKRLSELTGYKYYKFFKAITHDGGEYGTAILSKYPIEESKKINLSSGSAEQRVLGYTKINVNGTMINFFVTHLSYDGEGGGSSRSKQFSEIAAELAKYDNFVLSGDFNTRNLDEYNVIEGSALVNTKEDPKVTYPDGRSPLDNLVYSTENWKLGVINVVTDSYSDHYMIHSMGTYTEKK